MNYPGPHEDYDSGTDAWDEDFWSYHPDWDETMVDLGGGMVVPLHELLEDDDD